MHERSLVRALLKQVQKVADENSGGRVLSILVRIGEFSGVEPELVASAYNQLVQETDFSDASLELEQTPLVAVCDQCGYNFRIEHFDFNCGRCGSLHLKLCGGEEMLLDSVTMEGTEL
jgi:hydrogenase nickel incorporation protein HypA/HybF